LSEMNEHGINEDDFIDNKTWFLKELLKAYQP
jgi:hypothetical protein